ncbi:alpha/beta fold hydrolase [Nocardia speluncae]|uniref:Alpha/beta fold hydrolase n=1 Tax=Nocardia speluncae TaxID=419477 RepID=A0A846X9F8_9NOCA|nr:alpha/beta fold hydrolase [Nocardia speluncae]NKY32065.1 alpha/beta fold hydrolase [Nocardia speluncae]
MNTHRGDEPETLEFGLPHLAMTALAWGAPDGRLALCLHGFPDSAWTWRRLGPALADRGFRVIAPFTRGYAPTAVPADGVYHLGALAYDALAIHHAFGAPDDAVLIGHDWGALTANTIAADPGCPFRRVVSLAVPPVPGMRPQRAETARSAGAYLRQLRYSWYILFNQLPGVAERAIDRLVPRLWQDWSPGYPAAEDIAHALDALPPGAHRTAALSYYRAFVRVTAKVPEPYAGPHRFWDQAPRVPMLYLHGSADTTLHPAFTAGVAEVLAPAGGAVDMVPGAGHFLHLEQPAVVAGLIGDFLTDGSAPRS